jgi:hypothetical protein
VTIVADEALTVGSTDITLNWDVAGIQVDSAFSSVLSSFVSNIDNANRTVATASASGGSDNIPAGTTLMTFMLTANEPGVYNLFITDGDGIAPDDLAGPVPPIPPVSIPYTAVGASLTVTPLPDTDGDGIPDVDDNCPFVPNEFQENAGSPPAGDACQCGDVNNDGFVDGLDVQIARENLVGHTPLSGDFHPERCNVIGTSDCGVDDIFVLDRVAEGVPVSLQNVCDAYSAP